MKEYQVSVTAERSYFGSTTIEAASLDEAIEKAKAENAAEWPGRELGLEAAWGEEFRNYEIQKVEADDGSEEEIIEPEPEIRKGSLRSCFVLDEDGTWGQPTYLADRDMNETEFSRRVLADYGGRHSFLVVGVQEDSACPVEDARRFSP